MSARKFRSNVESGRIPVDCHDQLLRIAFIYVYECDTYDGVFRQVDQLHAQGWSFGQGNFKFNRYDFQVDPPFVKED